MSSRSATTAIRCLICAVFVLTAPTLAEGQAQRTRFVSFYAGQYSNTTLNEIVRFQTDLESSHVFVLSAGQEFWRFKGKVGLELEGQVGKHTGKQSHFEFNGVMTLRWHPFPWDRYLDTSFAVGNGFSYATEDPELEIREADDERTAPWLHYILVETAFSLPDYPQWDLFVRIHHRSSIFGLIDGLFSASNFVGLGLRYRF